MSTHSRSIPFQVQLTTIFGLSCNDVCPSRVMLKKGSPSSAIPSLFHLTQSPMPHTPSFPPGISMHGLDTSSGTTSTPRTDSW
ncbi:uncharacterized protein K444DRAFT_362277 [Hyaloscypha bicolor E]|uniref:Uncharacterized protein n=1 Tax=Hyaloscypha bicolor E TaxID=1095630 RepID=A0A2J6TGE3_9HELO|nr:uncharacterized protein K444DRAFT_362277 [Hyaloscypha bicolor E]PMD62097.1 hypothetical protein K444DRAFT_362277 [Hyaloscypha bicolor E]